MKSHTNSDLEVSLSCGGVELRSTRESGGIDRLLWGGDAVQLAGTDGRSSTVPADAAAGTFQGVKADAPPQLHMVYSSEEGGSTRMLVVNLHGTRAILSVRHIRSALAFFATPPKLTAEPLSHPRMPGRRRRLVTAMAPSLTTLEPLCSTRRPLPPLLLRRRMCLPPSG